MLSSVYFGVHLAITHSPSEMVVTFHSKGTTENTFVEFRECGSSLENCTTVQTLINSNNIHSNTITHTCLLTGLLPSTKYHYRVGDKTNNNWSKWFWFETRSSVSFNDSRIAVIGDIEATGIGLETINKLQSRVDEFDLVLVLGDLCYAKGDTNVWDNFTDMLEPIAAYRPLMVLPGNHENEEAYGKGYDEYNFRFNMPCTEKDAHYYTFTFGRARFVIISTEESLQPESRQAIWLEETLKNAQQEKEWTIVAGHRSPISSMDRKYSKKKAPVLRKVIEPLLLKYDVSLALFGHVHTYERTAAIKDKLIYCITGTGGTKLDEGWLNPLPWYSKSQQSIHGITYLHVRDNNKIDMVFRATHDDKIKDSSRITRVFGKKELHQLELPLHEATGSGF